MEQEASMRVDDWDHNQGEPEDYSSSIHQRTEELYRIPDGEVDADGLVLPHRRGEVLVGLGRGGQLPGHPALHRPDVGQFRRRGAAAGY